MSIIPTTCNTHCGGSCPLKVHVENGTITRIETDDEGEPQFRACLKGRAFRQRVYAPDRLLYPMKRVGDRGEGRFQRISWDEALDTVARELFRVRDVYGPASIIFRGGGGDLHVLHQRQAILRALCLFGGCTTTWGYLSYEGACFSALATYGTEKATSHTMDDLLNSRLIIMWGWNPVVTVHRCNTTWYLAQAREKGIPIVSVDPRYTDSAAAFAQRWVPIRPGTDAAMLIAMAYVIITEGLQDQGFLDRYTVGFDKFKDCILGKEDGVPKTPGWAEAITGVPAETIAGLAREYATTKPAALMAGIAAGRTAYGEQYHRAATTLAAMTGNIGIHGGGAAERAFGGDYWGGQSAYLPLTPGRLPVPPNAIEKDNPPPARPGRFYGCSVRLNIGMLADAILKGREGGYPTDYKLMWIVNANFVTQTTDVNKTLEALRKLEFIVVQEQFMTPTAKYADILLPDNTFMERNDFTSGGATPFFGCVNQTIASRGESKSHFEIASLLANKLGVEDFSNKTEAEWLRQIAAGYSQVYGAPDYAEMKRVGVHKLKRTEPYVAFREQIEEPEKYPFPTPSGKIEIYSESLAKLNDPMLPPVPKYIETWESINDPLAAKYPLQLITSHFKRRAHSQFDNIPWLRELEPQALWINVRDAESRGIRDGDMVRVFNDRGQVVISARVSERIMPGVVDLPEGAWYDPDTKGVDRGGCCNVLTRNVTSPAGALSSNTALVQVEKMIA
ncbi:MAG: molybdopterin-dependent oxidoreductase [Chloroflexi bacterium]|nr:molybdopterin-dependent oxidoreductase [Chloroflexota bacterium]